MQQMNRNTIIKLMLTLLLAAYASFLFHEFGHWLIGTLLGYKMAMSLNATWLMSGSSLKQSHSLYFVIGGPAFTILQAMIALLIIEKYKSPFAYPFLFFPFILRIFSWAMGIKFGAEDEMVISVMLGLKPHIVVIIVFSILLALVWKGSRTLKLTFKINSAFCLCSIAFILVVIATNKLLLLLCR
jgi:hypothetical protein